MRTAFVLACVIVLTAGGVAAAAADASLQTQIDALMTKWVWAIGHEYVDGYAECYWPEATAVTHDRAGQVIATLAGVKAIRQRQQDWSDQMDMSKIDLAGETTRFLPSDDGDIAMYIWVQKGFPSMTTVRDGGDHSSRVRASRAKRSDRETKVSRRSPRS